MSEIIGYLSALLTTLSFLPQAIQTIRTQDTKGISLTMYTLLVLGVFGWMIYGILIHNRIVILSNFFTLISSTIILTIKIKNKISNKE